MKYKEILDVSIFKGFIVLTLFSGIFMLFNNLFAENPVVEDPTLSIELLDRRSREISGLGKQIEPIKFFKDSIILATDACSVTQKDDAIKIAGFNLFATMIKNLEKLHNSKSDTVSETLKYLIQYSLMFPEKEFGVRSYEYDEHDIYKGAQYNVNIQVRIAAMKVFLALKNSFSNLFDIKSNEANSSATDFVVSAAAVIDSVFALSLFESDDVEEREKDNNVDIRIMALNLMAFIRDNLGLRRLAFARDLKSKIINDIQTIINSNSADLMLRFKQIEKNLENYDKSSDIGSGLLIYDFAKASHPFTEALEFAKMVCASNQVNDQIKISGLNLFAIMIKNLEAIPKHMTYEYIPGELMFETIRQIIPSYALMFARKQLGIKAFKHVTFGELSYYFDKTLYNDNPEVRIAAMRIFLVLKDNFSNLYYIESLRQPEKLSASDFLETTAAVIDSVFALPFSEKDDDIRGREKDDNEEVRMMALNLMAFIRDNLDLRGLVLASHLKSKIINDIQTIINENSADLIIRFKQIKDNLENFDQFADYDESFRIFQAKGNHPFVEALEFAKMACASNLVNDQIKISGLNLFAIMIENLKVIPKEMIYHYTINIRHKIIAYSLSASEKQLGVKNRIESYSFDKTLYNDNPEVRIAAMRLLIALKNNFDDLVFIDSEKTELDYKKALLEGAASIVASIFALPLFKSDDIKDRREDNNVDIRMMALDLMLFVNEKVYIIKQGEEIVKQQIIDNTQAIIEKVDIEKADKRDDFWNSKGAKEKVALLADLELNTCSDISDSDISDSDISSDSYISDSDISDSDISDSDNSSDSDNFESDISDSSDTDISDISEPKCDTSKIGSDLIAILNEDKDLETKKLEADVFKTIVPQEDNIEAREFSEKVAAEFAQKTLEQLFGRKNSSEFKRVFSNLKDSIVAGFKSANGSIGGINYDTLPLNISYTKYKGTTLQRFLLVIKLFDHGKLTDKGLRSAIAQLVSEWKRRRILEK